MGKSYAEVIQEYGFCVIRPKGTSMYPMLKGDVDAYLVRPEFPLKVHDVPVYRRESGELVMHRILKIEDSGYVCCGDNQWELEYGIRDENIIGVLDSWHKDGKTRTVRDPSYLRYVRFWCRSLRRRRFLLCSHRKYVRAKEIIKSAIKKLLRR